MKKVSFKVVGRKAHLLDKKYDKKLKNFFSYSVAGARFTPQFRAGAWDGKISMMRGGVVHVGLLRGLKKELEKEKWNVKIKKWKNRPEIKENKKGIISKDPKYHYQNKCVREMLDAVKWGGGIILSATGTGKTAIASMLASWVQCPILFVVDQRNLLYQAQKEIEEWLSKYEHKKVSVGVVGDSKFSVERVTVATIQTLNAHARDPKFLKWFKTVEIAIIDEIHTQMSRRNFAVMDIIKPKAVFGLTATLQLRKKPIRMRAYSICGPTIFEFPVAKASEQGVLAKGCAIQVRVNSDAVFEKIRPYWHYDAREGPHQLNLEYKFNVVRNGPVNDAAIAIVKEALKRERFVALLVERIRHLGILKERLKKHNPQVCSGSVSNDSRERRKDRFEKGDSKLLLATKVFTKGVNIKRLDLIIDAAQRGGNKDDVMQKYGRGVRLHPDKGGLIFIGLVSATNKKPTRKGQPIPKTEKAAKSWFNVLKKSGIPVKTIEYVNAKKTLDEAEKFLATVLQKGK